MASVGYEIISNGLYVNPKHLGYVPANEKPRPADVKICRLWIRQWISPRKTINRSHNSYGLKHFVEQAHGEHVSNGAFIQAAVQEGYKLEPCGLHSPNAYFNMSFVRLRKEEEKSSLAD